MSCPDTFLKKACVVCQGEANTIQWSAGEGNNGQTFLRAGLWLLLSTIFLKNHPWFLALERRSNVAVSYAFSFPIRDAMMSMLHRSRICTNARLQCEPGNT